MLRVVAFACQGAGPLPEIDRDTRAKRNNIGAVRLENSPIDFRPQLVRGIRLQGLCGLSPLEIQPCAERLAILGIGRTLDHQVCLIQAEGGAEHIVSTQEVGPSNGSVEVVAVVSIDLKIDGCAAQKIRSMDTTATT